MSAPSLKPPRGSKAVRPNPRDERLELHAERLIAAHELIPREGSLVVGVSGGPDSVALLDFLLGYRARQGVPQGDLIAGHVNHGLRGEESEADAAFVEELAARLGIRFMTSRIDPVARQRERGESLEEAARKLRYRELRRMAVEAGCARVAVAHTADDQAETILLRLIRGAGITGLSGMRPLRKLHGLEVARPFLTTTKRHVLEYLKRRGLVYREDSSNQTTNPRRNFVRLELLPRIRMLNPSIQETLLRESALFAEVDRYLAAEAGRVLPGVVLARERGKIELDAAALLLYPELLCKYIFRYVLRELNEDTLDLSTAHISALHSLLTSRSGRAADFPMGIKARRERGALVVTKREGEPEGVEAPSKA
jgi:tRNA(Ile)-lysidine synthase